MKNIIIPFLVLLGYRKPKHNLNKKRNELFVSGVLVLIYLIYYCLTIITVHFDNEISAAALFSWFISMSLTAIDNIKRYISGLNRFKKLTNSKHSKTKLKIVFHSGFYRSVLWIEIFFTLSTVLIHFEQSKNLEKIFMIIATWIYMFQALIHAFVDMYGMEDIEKKRC